jgi:hypothetical protein
LAEKRSREPTLADLLEEFEKFSDSLFEKLDKELEELSKRLEEATFPPVADEEEDEWKKRRRKRPEPLPV